MSSYYDLLEITRDATQEEIKKAYRKMAVKHHPDKGGDEEIFKKVSEAYTVLSDESKKRVYDMGGDPNTQSGNPFNMGGGFNFNMGGGGFPFNMGGGGFPFNFNMGGGGFKQDFNQEKLKDIEVVMEVTLEELYTSVEKSLTIRAEEKCSCIKVCDMCKGYGFINQTINLGIIRQVTQARCKKCVKRGFLYSNNCKICFNNGVNDKLYTYNILIPKGVNSDWSYKIESKGEQATKTYQLSGDLIVKLKVKPHTYLQREGEHIVYNKNITFIESVCGMKFSFKYLDGVEVEIDTLEYPIIYTNYEIVIKNKGFKREISGTRDFAREMNSTPRSGSEFGDLIIRFKVEYPKEIISAEERD